MLVRQFILRFFNKFFYLNINATTNEGESRGFEKVNSCVYLTMLIKTYLIAALLLFVYQILRRIVYKSMRVKNFVKSDI